MLQQEQLRRYDLEKQVAELRKTNEELEAARNKYALLYDSAPVGYFTFGRDGEIRTVNLTGANLLGSQRTRLANRRFEYFVSSEDRGQAGTSCANRSYGSWGR